MEVTKRQKQVLKDVFNGAVFICDSDVTGACISGDNIKEDYHINNGVFFRLVEKKLIYQTGSPNFDYVLTIKAINLFNPIKN